MLKFLDCTKMGYSRKNPNRGERGGGGAGGLRIGNGISRGTEESACENSRGQLKKEVESLGILKKNSCRISMGLGF